MPEPTPGQLDLSPEDLRMYEAPDPEPQVADEPLVPTSSQAEKNYDGIEAAEVALKAQLGPVREQEGYREVFRAILNAEGKLVELFNVSKNEPAHLTNKNGEKQDITADPAEAEKARRHFEKLWNAPFDTYVHEADPTKGTTSAVIGERSLLDGSKVIEWESRSYEVVEKEVVYRDNNFPEGYDVPQQVATADYAAIPAFRDQHQEYVVNQAQTEQAIQADDGQRISDASSNTIWDTIISEQINADTQPLVAADTQNSEIQSPAAVSQSTSEQKTLTEPTITYIHEITPPSNALVVLEHPSPIEADKVREELSASTNRIKVTDSKVGNEESAIVIPLAQLVVSQELNVEASEVSSVPEIISFETLPYEKSVEPTTHESPTFTTERVPVVFATDQQSSAVEYSHTSIERNDQSAESIDVPSESVEQAGIEPTPISIEAQRFQQSPDIIESLKTEEIIPTTETLDRPIEQSAGVVEMSATETQAPERAHTLNKVHAVAVEQQITQEPVEVLTITSAEVAHLPLVEKPVVIDVLATAEQRFPEGSVENLPLLEFFTDAPAVAEQLHTLINTSEKSAELVLVGETAPDRTVLDATVVKAEAGELKYEFRAIVQPPAKLSPNSILQRFETYDWVAPELERDGAEPAPIEILIGANNTLVNEVARESEDTTATIKATLSYDISSSRATVVALENENNQPGSPPFSLSKLDETDDQPTLAPPATQTRVGRALT